jgi:hypothetical protein
MQVRNDTEMLFLNLDGIFLIQAVKKISPIILVEKDFKILD